MDGPMGLPVCFIPSLLSFIPSHSVINSRAPSSTDHYVTLRAEFFPETVNQIKWPFICNKSCELKVLVVLKIRREDHSRALNLKGHLR
jgi:hypothetical protein